MRQIVTKRLPIEQETPKIAVGDRPFEPLFAVYQQQDPQGAAVQRC